MVPPWLNIIFVFAFASLGSLLCTRYLVLLCTTALPRGSRAHLSLHVLCQVSMPSYDCIVMFFVREESAFVQAKHLLWLLSYSLRINCLTATNAWQLLECLPSEIAMVLIHTHLDAAPYSQCFGVTPSMGWIPAWIFMRLSFWHISPFAVGNS